MVSSKDRILKCLLSNIGAVVSREELRKKTNASDWARRIRDLRQEGWRIKTVKDGYILESPEKVETGIVANPIKAKQRYRILHRDNSRCRRCGKSAEDSAKMVVDHITPRDWGGSDDDSNL